MSRPFPAPLFDRVRIQYGCRSSPVYEYECPGCLSLRSFFTDCPLTLLLLLLRHCDWRLSQPQLHLHRQLNSSFDCTRYNCRKLRCCSTSLSFIRHFPRLHHVVETLDRSASRFELQRHLTRSSCQFNNTHPELTEDTEHCVQYTERCIVLISTTSFSRRPTAHNQPCQFHSPGFRLCSCINSNSPAYSVVCQNRLVPKSWSQQPFRIRPTECNILSACQQNSHASHPIRTNRLNLKVRLAWGSSTRLSRRFATGNTTLTPLEESCFAKIRLPFAPWEFHCQSPRQKDTS